MNNVLLQIVLAAIPANEDIRRKSANYTATRRWRWATTRRGGWGGYRSTRSAISTDSAR